MYVSYHMSAREWQRAITSHRTNPHMELSAPSADDADNIWKWRANLGGATESIYVRVDRSIAESDLRSNVQARTRSTWGIQSTWSVVDDPDGGVIVTLDGPRQSLRDWCPLILLALADVRHRQGRLIEYRTLCPSSPPSAWDLTPESPEWVSDAEDAQPGDRFLSRSRVWPCGAFAKF